MKKIAALIGALLIVVLVVHFSFANRQLNVVLITMDTTRADFFSCYNPKAVKTPGLDRIAKKSMLFENAFSLIPITFPAHSSIFLSKTPHEMNVFNNGDFLKVNEPLLAELLAKQGYHTGAFVSMAALKDFFGLAKGFGTYKETFRDLGRPYAYASEVNQFVFPWLEHEQNNRFFLWIHYSDPHFPYVPIGAPADTQVSLNGELLDQLWIAKKERIQLEMSLQPGENKLEFQNMYKGGANRRTYFDYINLQNQPGVEMKYGPEFEGEKRKLEKEHGPEQINFFVGHGTMLLTNHNPAPVNATVFLSGKVMFLPETVRERYGQELLFMDQEIGKLWDKLEDLKLRDKTIVVITSDHGECIGEHGKIGHVFPLVQELVHVPLIVYYPGIGRSGRSKQLVNHMDIRPTILDLLHMQPTGNMEGQSLKQYISWSPIDMIFGRRSDRIRTFCETYAPAGKADSYAVVENHMKLIQTKEVNGWSYELYNLVKDPKEQHNLAQDSSMQPLLAEFAKEAEESHSHHKNPKLDEESKQMLRDLGYIAQ
ncbi:MAG: hypothetical protein C5B54_07615 [Acidobacteria bacterium]|nr:MAG: hypothetical protein C5B54_07615 [Acidobacteriota bacterium]